MLFACPDSDETDNREPRRALTTAALRWRPTQGGSLYAAVILYPEANHAAHFQDAAMDRLPALGRLRVLYRRVE
jgi:hypothetical protein